MTPYRNLQGDSGVVAWEGGMQYIAVKFRSGEVYLYTDEATGSRHVARMKKLAAEGKGLSTYISRYVKNKFESKRV